MSTLIDAAWCRERRACYSDRRLARLFDRPMTLLEVLTRRDGPWKRVPAKDRLWPFFIAAPRAAKAAVVNRAADRQVRAHCLHCGIKTVERWAARWLSGEDRSAALAWASASRAARAAEEASWAAGRAPRAAAKAAAAAARAALRAAAWVASWAAEHRAQLADAIEVMAGDDPAKEQP